MQVAPLTHTTCISPAEPCWRTQVREGKSGTLQAFVIPNVSPKTCVAVSHRIRPLCLHTRLPGEEEPGASKPTNELLICGVLCWTAGVSAVQAVHT